MDDFLSMLPFVFVAMAVNRRAIEAGRAYVRAYLDDSLFRRGLRRVEVNFRMTLRKLERLAKQLGPKLQSAGRGLAAVGATITAPFVLAVKTFSDLGSELADMSARTGLSAEALSELKFAADQSGASVESLEKGVRAMQKTLFAAESGSKASVETLAELGLTVDELKGLKPEEQFTRIADALSRVPDPGKRAALAMKVFGRGGAELLPLMAGGAAGIDELRKKARELGLTLSTEDVQAAEKFGDQLDVLKTVGLAKLFQIGAVVGPMLGDLAERLARNGRSAGLWIKENKTLVAWVFKLGAAITAIGSTLAGFGLAFSGVATGITAAKTAAALLAANLPLVGAALAAVGIAVFAKHVYDSTEAMKALNAELGRAAVLNAQIGGRREQDRQSIRHKAATTADPVKRREFLTAELGKAATEMEGLEASLNGANKRFRELDTTFNQVTGNQVRADAKREADEARKAFTDQQKFVDELLALIDETEKPQPKADASPASPSPGNDSAGSPFLAAWNAGVEKVVGGIQSAAEGLGLVTPRMSVGEWLESLVDPPATDDTEAPESPTLRSGAADAINRAAVVGTEEGTETALRAMNGFGADALTTAVKDGNKIAQSMARDIERLSRNAVVVAEGPT